MCNSCALKIAKLVERNLKRQIYGEKYHSLLLEDSTLSQLFLNSFVHSIETKSKPEINRF
jgi:hypothetical protein